MNWAVSCLLLAAQPASARPVAPTPTQLLADSLRQLPRWPLARQQALSQTRLLPGSPLVPVAQDWVSRRGQGLARDVYWNLEMALGRYYIDANQPSKAVRQLLTLRQQCGTDSARSSLANMWLCYSYLNLGQVERSIPFGHEAIRWFPRTTPAPHNRQDIYTILAGAAVDVGNRALQEHYLLKCLALDEASGVPQDIGMAYLLLVNPALDQRRYALAHQRLDSARRYLRPLRDDGIFVLERQITARLAIAEHRYRAAEGVLRATYPLMRSRPVWEGEVLKLLVPALVGQHRYQEALVHQQRLAELQFGTFEATAHRQAQELQEAYAANEREREIARQRQRIGHLQAQEQLQAAQYSRRLAWLGAAVLAGALLLTLAGGWWAARQRRLRAEREERLRNRIATDLHDDVGTLLARVTMQADLLRQQAPAAEGPALDRLLANARAAAGTMRDIVWGIDTQADAVSALLDRMREHLDQSAAAAGLNTHLAVSGLADEQPLASELRQHLFLVFKEAVTNAVRHAHATDLWVTLAWAPHELCLEVRDNGRPAAPPAAGRQSSGLGLRSMRQRAQALDGTLQAAPGPEGFIVRLVVPLKVGTSMTVARAAR